jgi:TolB protein
MNLYTHDFNGEVLPTHAINGLPGGYPTWSSFGDQIAFTLYDPIRYDISAIEPNGTHLECLENTARSYWWPVWSPDGRRIAYAAKYHDSWDIFIMDTDTYDVIQVTDDPADDWAGIDWSPDGEAIVFASNRSGNWDIFIASIDGASLTNLTNHPADDRYPSWSPNGRKILFETNRDELDPNSCEIDCNTEIYVMNTDGSGIINLTKHPASDSGPAWSHDGASIAFSSIRDNNHDIYVMDNVGKNLVRLTDHPANDIFPAWSPDARQIVFSSDRDRNFELYIVDRFIGSLIRLTNDDAGNLTPNWAR